MEEAFNMLNEICAGCLSHGRHMTHLTGAAAEFFNEIVAAAGGSTSSMVCWECEARVRGALKFRSIVSAAVHTLLSYQMNKITYFSTLSQLSCHTPSNVIHVTHDQDPTLEGPGQSPLFVKMEDDLDCHVEDDIKFEDMNLDADIKVILKPTSNVKKKRHKKKKKKTEKLKKEDFDESDNEPLASKTNSNDYKDESGTKIRRRGRREGAAGVVHSPRVANKLARLGVAAQALQMVVLSWEEVEAERQRALTSENYLRHEHRCEYCVLGFNHRLKLERHLEKHSAKAGDHECSVCRVRCRAAHALAAHRRRHRVRWRCAECGALWSRAAVAADHLRRAHPNHAAETPAMVHSCPTCSHKAPTLNKLRTHMRSHASCQTCQECGKTFRDRASLRTHLFSHRADKEHQCDKCSARFLYPRALRLHRLTHDPPPPFYCPQCDVTFKNPMSFYQHMKYSLKHVHPDKLKHACSECGAKFVRAARLVDHIAARHTHDAPHRCDQPGCDYKCASRSVLRAHVRSAHAPTPARDKSPRLVCHACGRTYTTKKSLERHLRTHSDSVLTPPTERTKRLAAPLDNTTVPDSVRFYIEQPQLVGTSYKTVQKET